jgi:hypothetical protein
MSRWLEVGGGVLRLGLALGLLWVCAADYPVVKAQDEFATLPDYDYWKESEKLLNQSRFSEALLVVDAGIAAAPEQAPALQSLRARIETERNSWMTRFQQMGRGAWTGRGESAEALGGAIVADLFVFGDVRDLVIQAGRAIRGEPTDPVITALSAGGILLTVNPAADLGSALFKFARRAGAMTETFAKNLLKTLERAVQRRNVDEVRQVTGDMAALSKRAGPSGALAILRDVDDAAELRLAARLSEQPGGVFALWLGGRPAIGWLTAGGDPAAALLLRGARKGRAGIEWLSRNSGVLLRAHPLVGLVKGFYKGNVPALIADFLRRWSMLLMGMAGGWLLYETCLLSAALGRALHAPRE